LWVDDLIHVERPPVGTPPSPVSLLPQPIPVVLSDRCNQPYPLLSPLIFFPLYSLLFRFIPFSPPPPLPFSSFPLPSHPSPPYALRRSLLNLESFAAVFGHFFCCDPFSLFSLPSSTPSCRIHPPHISLPPSSLSRCAFRLYPTASTVDSNIPSLTFKAASAGSFLPCCLPSLIVLVLRIRVLIRSFRQCYTPSALSRFPLATPPFCFCLPVCEANALGGLDSKGAVFPLVFQHLPLLF